MGASCIYIIFILYLYCMFTFFVVKVYLFCISFVFDNLVKLRVKQLSSLGILVAGTNTKPQQGNETVHFLSINRVQFKSGLLLNELD